MARTKNPDQLTTLSIPAKAPAPAANVTICSPTRRHGIPSREEFAAAAKKQHQEEVARALEIVFGFMRSNTEEDAVAGVIEAASAKLPDPIETLYDISALLGTAADLMAAAREQEDRS